MIDKDKLGFDPYTCPIDELEKKIEEFGDQEEYWNTMQLSAKTFINSVYGVFGTKFFNLANTDIAESITLQGQHLIKWSVEQINDYFKNKWKDDVEGHLKIAKYMKDKFDDFDDERFLKLSSSNSLSFNTLQIYGDSVVGDSIVDTTDGKIKISDLFNCVCTSESHEKIRVKCDKMVYCVSSNGSLMVKPILYIMRHLTNKQIIRVWSDDDHVDVTSDHSLIIMRDGEMVCATPASCVVGDTIIKFVGNSITLSKITNIENVSEKYENYVYDIAVKSEDGDCHNFFANGFLVHNTDSVSKDSLIRTKKHPDGIKIEDFYSENIKNSGECTLAGHESVHTDDKVLNFSKDDVLYSNVKRIIRHKVKNKRMWKLRTKSGKEVICTEDHSLIVFRNGKQITIKPTEIKDGDLVVEF